MTKLQLIGVGLIVVFSSIMVRDLFPKTVQTPAPPPRIHTVYDTVTALDTVWVDRIREVVTTDTVNLVEVRTVTVTDTIEVCPTISGVTAVEVGEARGDSTMVLGFDLTNTGSAILFNRWTQQYWTPGPLKALAFTDDGVDVSFGEYTPPVKPYSFWNKLGNYLAGAGIGFGACLVAK